MTNNTHKVALFPKKSSALGVIFLIIILILGSFIISNLWKSLSDVDKYHFPIIERSSINVRLINMIKYEIELAQKTKDDSLSEHIKLNFDSLKQNYNSMSKMAKNENLGDKTSFFKKGENVTKLIDQKDWDKLKLYLKQSKFENLLEEFSFEVFDITEEMAEKRDNQSEKILLLIKNSIIIFVFVFLFLIYLVLKIYKGYQANLKQRVTAENQVKSLSHQRQTLIHVLCHDLGNPISAIFSLTKVGHLLPESEKVKLIETIRENAENSLNIIDITRKMEALELGSLKLELSPINIKEACEKSLNILQEKINSKKLIINMNDLSPVNVQADEVTLINSILSNILSNSIKFSHPNTTITIKTYENVSTIELEIIDQGVGIPDEILAKIYEETSSTSRLGTDGEVGTGFGMPLTKKFIEAYGGAIKITSEINKGTKTKLTFNRS